MRNFWKELTVHLQRANARSAHLVWHLRAVSEHVHLQRANARLGVLIWHSRTVSEHLHWIVSKGNTPVLSKVLEC